MDLAHFRFELLKKGTSKPTLPCVNPFGTSQDPIGGTFGVKNPLEWYHLSFVELLNNKYEEACGICLILPSNSIKKNYKVHSLI